MRLYELNLYDTTQEPCTAFFIGIFSSRRKAEEAGEKLLREAPGFRDRPCRYEIEEKLVAGEEAEPEKVSLVVGWDEDEDLEPVHIVESDLYADPDDAEAALRTLQKVYKRQEWCIDHCEINKIDWSEGFVKV